MKKKQFKAESKKLLNLMINSIYTNKDIFLRELISNASDAMDKIYFKSLTDNSIKIDRKDLKIELTIDKENKTITIKDNGCGMSKDELDENLGIIAESNSSKFKDENKSKDINIIGQFGVGFYSVFMVADEVSVCSKPYNSEKSYVWKSSGEDGYTIEESNKDTYGTEITIKIKDDTEDYKFSKYLDTYTIEELVKKYSNYIHFPITLPVTHKDLKEGSKDEYVEHTEIDTLNSITPLWKKDKSKITDEEYSDFYTSSYYDYEKPLHIINYKAEGNYNYNCLLFIPSHVPFDLYSKSFKKGLQLYSNGVLIMDKCEDLLPDYYGFIHGLVDSEDLSLNISRELLQQDKQLKVISKNIEKKIKNELMDMLKNDRDKYEKFFKEFGIQLKLGIYNSYGASKDELQDLLLFYSSKEEKLITLKEYIDKMKKDQKKIYYAVGESIDKINLIPQIEDVKDKDFEILYLTEYADEFVIQMMQEYNKIEFMNITSSSLDLETEEEQEKEKEINKENNKLLEDMKDVLKDKVVNVKFTSNLKNHPVCLSNEGAVSTGMEKILNSMPNEEKVKASTILLINANHPIYEKLKSIYKNNKQEFEDYSKILYAQAKLIEGLTIDNPNEISNLVCNILSK